jgi:hypothetical protein
MFKKGVVGSRFKGRLKTLSVERKVLWLRRSRF